MEGAVVNQKEPLGVLEIRKTDSWPPRFEGKRSAVAAVNDSPVGCQSRDRAARRRLARRKP